MHIGQRCEAYYNLHNECLSARPTGRYGYVKHYQWLIFHGVKFAVQPAGRQKVLRERKKNVHAFVRGEMMSWSPAGKGKKDRIIDSVVSAENMRADDRFVEVTYNPYKYESFVIKETGQPIYEADKAWIFGKYIFVLKSWTG